MFGLSAQFRNQSDVYEMTFSDGELVVDVTATAIGVLL